MNALLGLVISTILPRQYKAGFRVTFLARKAQTFMIPAVLVTSIDLFEPLISTVAMHA